MSGATHHRRPGRGQAAQLEGCCARRGVGARAGWRVLGNALALSCTGTFDRAHTRQRTLIALATQWCCWLRFCLVLLAPTDDEKILRSI